MLKSDPQRSFARPHQALIYARFGPPGEVLRLMTCRLPPRPAGGLRVKMLAAPINPSDLIPISGAYRHRVQPPRVAGYEGVGEVVEADNPDWLGRRVLPLRSAGTWQTWLDCDPRWCVPVPDRVDSLLAAQAYINPLTAYLMLRRWPVKNRHVLLTAASSAFAQLLTQWALWQGARKVTGVVRSASHITHLTELGMQVILDNDTFALQHALQSTDLLLDAVGGTLAQTCLSGLSPQAEFVSYGLLSGQAFVALNGIKPQRFHLHDVLPSLSEADWQQHFSAIWPLLEQTNLPPCRTFDLTDWQAALHHQAHPQRKTRPILLFSAY